MKKVLVHICLFLCVIVFAGTDAPAQPAPALTLDTGVKAREGIDAIYARFSDAYKNLTPGVVADLYTDTADYLPAGGKPIKGRTAILESFTGFFDSVKQRGQTMAISFRITQREVTDTLGYDVGIYTLTTFKDGKQLGQGRGQFVVVTKKIGKKWFFQLDTYSNLPQENPDKK